ncbi:hypothetical protein [Metabacillus fastidiosus]|uniref:hypothetical protein n=1 Tax=Metabacillus fastidiosus TaxID=1458 RepID=UPI002E22D311|nr:hypothetical protein [Metabacillus fastidiosus]
MTILEKLRFMLLFIILPLTLAGLFYSKNDLPLEMVAFESLTDEEANLILVSPKDSIVEKVTVNNHIASLINKNYTKNKIYSVTFNGTETDSAGNLVVYVDLDRTDVVGKGFNEK